MIAQPGLDFGKLAWRRGDHIGGHSLGIQDLNCGPGIQKDGHAPGGVFVGDARDLQRPLAAGSFDFDGIAGLQAGLLREDGSEDDFPLVHAVADVVRVATAQIEWQRLAGQGFLGDE